MNKIILALLLLLSVPARAAYEDLGAGARAPGMGDAFVPVADDLYAMYYNPAGLGLLTRPQFGTSYTKLLTGLTDGSDLNTSFIGYVQPLREGRQGTLGVAWNSLSLNNSLYRDQSYSLSYGRLVHSGAGDLYAGANAKLLSRSFGTFPDIDNATLAGGLAKSGRSDPALANRKRRAFDADLGLLYRIGPHYSFGAALIHAAQPNVSFAGAKDRVPATLKAGVNYRSLVSNLVAELDVRRSEGGARADEVFTVAAERWFPRLFIGDLGARAGMSLGSRDYKVLSLGVSFRTRRVQVDYGFQLPINTVEGTAGSHKMAMSFRFGRASEEEESMEMVLEAMRQLRYGALPEKLESKGLSKGQQSLLDEYMLQVRHLQSQARYKEALDKMSLALTVAPADKELVAKFGRLNFVGQQIKQLNDFKTDPMQATLHQGLIAYIAGNDGEAVAKVSEALALKPAYRELEVFLEQLETVTGLKRTMVAAKKPADYGLATLLTQAALAIEEKRYEEAIDLSLRVTEHDEGNAQAWANLGTAYFALREYDRSLEAWKKALQYEKSPAVREAIKGYLKSITRAKDRKPSKTKPAPQAEPVFEAGPSLTPAEIESLYNEGIDFYIKRDLEKAKAVFEKILEAAPNHVEARKALRRVKEEMPQ
jgi:hypothetical protein